jgi:hypothetical protein
VASSSEKEARLTGAAQNLERHLRRLKELRGRGRKPPARLTELKEWQARRLTATYEDFAAQPRYRAATSFFIGDLYGAKDFSERDQAMLRIFPVMTRILPASAVETAALAIELEALSEELDQKLAAALAGGPITAATYAEAYRRSSTPEERARQIELIDAVGHRLDALVRKPLVSHTLKLMRQPARMAGLADLQDFLERGFAAFRDMKGADEFLATLRRREGAFLKRLFSGEAEPFSPPA